MWFFLLIPFTCFYLSTESVCDLSEEMLLQIQTRQFGAACPRVKLAPATATKKSGSVWLRRRTPKCSVAAASSTAQLEVKSESKTKPFPAEVSRTLMELAKVGTLCTLTEEGLPLGTGVRFAVEPEHGTPLFSFDSSDNTNIPSSLHVQVPHFPSLSLSVSLLIHLFGKFFMSVVVYQFEQFGLRIPQCSVQGTLTKPQDPKVSVASYF